MCQGLTIQECKEGKRRKNNHTFVLMERWWARPWKVWQMNIPPSVKNSMFMVSFSKLNTSLPLEWLSEGKTEPVVWRGAHHERDWERLCLSYAETPWKSASWQALLRCSQRAGGLLTLPHAISWLSVTAVGRLSLIYYCIWVSVCTFKANRFIADA